MGINKKSFVNKIVEGVKGANEARKNFKYARKQNRKTKKNIDEIVRRDVRKNKRLGDTAEQLQDEFNKKRKKKRKAYGF